MKIKTLWWLIRPTKRGKSDQIEVRTRFGTLIPGKISKDDPTKFYPSKAVSFIVLGATEPLMKELDGVELMEESQ